MLIRSNKLYRFKQKDCSRVYINIKRQYLTMPDKDGPSLPRAQWLPAGKLTRTLMLMRNDPYSRVKADFVPYLFRSINVAILNL